MATLYFAGAALLWLAFTEVVVPEDWLSNRCRAAWVSPILRSRRAGVEPALLYPMPRQPKVVRIIGRLNIGGPARQTCYLHQTLSDTFQTVLITGKIENGEGDMSYLLSSSENVYRIGS